MTTVKSHRQWLWQNVLHNISQYYLFVRLVLPKKLKKKFFDHFRLTFAEIITLSRKE